MSDHGYVFSKPMVRLMLSGMKTQMRRILRPQPSLPISMYSQDNRLRYFISGPASVEVPVQPGDRLWIREEWSTHGCFDEVQTEDLSPDLASIHYWADGDTPTGCKRPALLMPRRLSRAWLQVTAVSIHRIQEIAEAGAKAEGVEYETADPPFWYVPGIWPHTRTAVDGREGPVASFRKLWEDQVGGWCWDTNPWVLAISFEVREGNIDAVDAAKAKPVRAAL